MSVTDTSVGSNHELGGDGGLELETRGSVGVLDVVGTLLRGVENQDLGGLHEFPDVPPLDLKPRRLVGLVLRIVVLGAFYLETLNYVWKVIY